MTVGCLSFLGVRDLYYIEKGGATIKKGSPIFFEIACMRDMETTKAISDFKRIEEARVSLILELEKSIERQINKHIKIMEDYGCKNIEVDYRHRILSVPADSPNGDKIGTLSYVNIAISGEKESNLEIFGIRA